MDEAISVGHKATMTMYVFQQGRVRTLGQIQFHLCNLVVLVYGVGIIHLLLIL